MASMKKKSTRRKRRLTTRVELGRHTVADPEICHGKPTIKGTRILVRQILEELAQGMSPDDIIGAWGGAVSQASIAECVRLKGSPTKGLKRFNRATYSTLTKKQFKAAMDSDVFEQ